MSEAAQAFAFVAKRAACRSMPASRWVHVLSLELGWMSPAQARAYVVAAQDAGLLAAHEGALRLTLDPESVEIGRRFRPDPGAVPEPFPGPPVAQDGFAGWLQKVAAATGNDAAETMDAVTKVQARFGGHLGAYPALLIAAREAGLEVQDVARAELDALMRS